PNRRGISIAPSGLVCRYVLAPTACAVGCILAPLRGWRHPHADSTFGHQQMPGFFVLGVFGILAVGGEEDVGLVVGRGQGENVEDVRGDYVGGEEVDLGWGVGDAVVVEVAFVGVAAVVDGAFDLDAEEVAPSVAIRSLRAGSLAGNSFLRAGYEEVVGGQSPQGRARISPCSVARSWKRSSAHSPRR